MSRALAPHTGAIVGVDISAGMVAVYNARAGARMSAVVADLAGAPGELDGRTFDVALCNAALHHIADAPRAARALVQALRPGGALLVADVLTPRVEDPANPLFEEKFHAMVPHRHGFSESDMRTLFKGAGLSDFEFREAFETEMHGKKIALFVARGVKPA
jgi:SAM-dependent methyltransferase